MIPFWLLCRAERVVVSSFHEVHRVGTIWLNFAHRKIKLVWARCERHHLIQQRFRILNQWDDARLCTGYRDSFCMLLYWTLQFIILRTWWRLMRKVLTLDDFLIVKAPLVLQSANVFINGLVWSTDRTLNSNWKVITLYLFGFVLRTWLILTFDALRTFRLAIIMTLFCCDSGEDLVCRLYLLQHAVIGEPTIWVRCRFRTLGRFENEHTFRELSSLLPSITFV